MIIWRYGRRRLVVALGLLDLIVAAQMVFFGLMLSALIGAAQAKDMGQFIRIAGLAAAGMTVIAIFNWVQASVQTRLVQSINLRIKAIMANDLVDTLPLTTPTSETLSFMTNDLKLVEENGTASELAIVENVITAVYATVAAATFDWLTTLFFIVGSLLPILVSSLTQKRVASASEHWSAENARYTGWLKDLLTGLDTIRTYRANAMAQRRVNQAGQRLEVSLRRMNVLTAHVSVVMSYLALGVSVLVPFGFGVTRVIAGVVSVAGLIGVMQLSQSITSPLLTVLGAINNRNTVKPILARIAAVQPTELPTVAPLAFTGLDLDHVALKRGDKLLFTDLSLHIKPGERVLIKAPSGFGKTSLLHALQGGLPLAAGTYTFNNVPAQTLPQLSQAFSLIKQTPFIFADTLAFNLTLGADFSPEALAAAAAKAHLSELVAAKSWEYDCGENGTNLSGGQIQRVELARAFLYARPVMLADEATAALDPALSDAVHEALFQSPATLIEVAHHISPAWEARFDQVITLTA